MYMWIWEWIYKLSLIVTDIVLNPLCAKCSKFPEFKISGDEAMKAGTAQAGAGGLCQALGLCSQQQHWRHHSFGLANTLPLKNEFIARARGEFVQPFEVPAACGHWCLISFAAGQKLSSHHPGSRGESWPQSLSCMGGWRLLSSMEQGLCVDFKSCF